MKERLKAALAGALSMVAMASLALLTVAASIYVITWFSDPIIGIAVVTVVGAAVYGAITAK